MLALILGVTLGAGAAPSGDRYTYDVNELPQAARSFLTRHFGAARIDVIKIDRHFMGSTEYDVALKNDIEVDFDHNGQWKSVDCQRAPVPDGIVPQGIRDYVARNCNGAFIVSIEKERDGGYDVGLSDRVDLSFDRNLTCTHIDRD